MMLDLVPGHWYKIKAIRSTLGPGYRRKLLAMGFLPGACILVKRIAPWNGPVQLEINDSSISLRSQELLHLLQLEEEPCR